MKKTFQKLATVILILAMVFTSVSLDTIQVSAASKKPTKITLNAKSKTLTVGKTFQLKVKSVKPTKASKEVTYKSSKKSVATVSSKGKITAKKAGKATITVTSKKNKKAKATCKVTVKNKVTPTKKPTVTPKPTATPKPTVTPKPTATPKSTATPNPTATPRPTMAPGESYGELNSPITDEYGNVTYSCIYFGNYPQSDVTGQTKDPIKWRVLYIKGDDAFLVADQNLDVMKYNETWTDKYGNYRNVTWETCTMRSWLNGYGSGANGDGIDYSSDNFIDRAFTSAEQAAILTTNVVNDDNPEEGTKGGNNTEDKIFLLSIDEVNNSAYGFLPYYKDSNTDYIEDVARQRSKTDYVTAGSNNWWWLRSPGCYLSAACVGNSGLINLSKNINNSAAVCPALHVNLSSSSVWSMAESVTVQRNTGATATIVPTVIADESYEGVDNPATDENGNVTYSCIYFGSYPQSDATGQTKDPIKWRVLSINGNDAFLVADKNLDVMEYNKTQKSVTWENCTMRSWLNGYGSESNVEGIDYSSDNFIDRAFNSTEQAAILTTNVVNDDNSEYGTAGGNDTQDKIFLLSIDEVSNSEYGFLPYYSVHDKARQRNNTVYVNNGGTIKSSWLKENGASHEEKWGGYSWCLRSPGGNNYLISYVREDGKVEWCGYIVYSTYDYAVCPALHINLSSSSTWSIAESVTVQR